MLAFKNGELQITNEEALGRWLSNPQPKHFNVLDFQNEYVQRSIEKFPEKDPLLVYNYLRMFYWTSCNTLEDFVKEIENRLKQIDDIEELFG